MSGEFEFKSGTGSTLHVELGHADSEDWIPTTISFATPALSGVTVATIRWDDFDTFARDLKSASASLPSSITWGNEECDIELTIRLGYLGHGKVSAIIRASGAQVLMDVGTDQAAMRTLATDLRRALSRTGRGEPFS